MGQFNRQSGTPGRNQFDIDENDLRELRQQHNIEASMSVRKELDLLPLLAKDQITVDSGQRHLCCPVCKSNYNHLKPPYIKDGGDSYEAKWNGRGDLVVVPMRGECGSKWEVCIGFHKGNSSIFARLTESCAEKK